MLCPTAATAACGVSGWNDPTGEESLAVTFKPVHRREAVTCAAFGVVGAPLFLFAFPKGAISTLMHEVLGLPGPGAGIALIFGPFLVVVVLVSSLVTHGDGGALIAAVVFAVAYALLIALLDVPTNPKGAFGSGLFIAAVVVFGMAAEAGMLLAKALPRKWRCVLCGASANALLFVFYWVAIFPRTAGWIKGSDVPLLMGSCLVGGLATGGIAWGLSKPLAKVLAGEEMG